MMALFTSIFILMAITIIVIYTANSVVMEQRISSNAFHGHQAMANVQGGIDHVANFINANSMLPADLSSYQTDMEENSIAVNNPVYTDSDVDRAALWAESRSVKVTDGSDCIETNCQSERTITQTYGAVPIASQGMNQSLINRGSIGISGNVEIINRYTNINVWSGDSIEIGNSAASESYILIPGTDTTDYTLAEFTDPAVNTGDIISVSGRQKGNGIDIIERDITLSQLSPNQFFVNFMNESKKTIKEMAIDEERYYSDFNGIPNNLSGLIWVGATSGASDLILNGGTFGSLADPVIMIVDVSNDDEEDMSDDNDVADDLILTIRNADIYGILYIIGNVSFSGSPTVTGSMVVEGNVVTSTGTMKIVFKPSRAGDYNLTNRTARVSGSWKDF